MSAYMDLFNAMDGNVRMSVRHELLKAYAHELAEKIRDKQEERIHNREPYWETETGALWAADLIDPKVGD